MNIKNIILSKLYRDDIKKDKEAIVLTSLISIISSIICFSYSFLFFYLEIYKAGFILISFSIYLFFVFLLSKSKYYRHAKNYFVFSNPIFLFIFSNLFGKDSLMQSFFILLACYYFIFFNENDNIIKKFYIAFTFLLFLLLELTDYSLIENISLNPDLLKLIRVSIIYANFTLVFLVLYFFKKSVLKVENSLFHLNNELQEKNNLLNETQKIVKTASYEKDLLTNSYKFSEQFFDVLEFKNASAITDIKELFFHIKVHPDDLRILDEIIKEKICKNIDAESTFRIIDNNKTKFIRVSIFFYFENNIPIKYIAVISDITKIKENELELIQAKEIAEKASKVRQEFLANMSHEIRTPMNAIIGFTNLLFEDIQSEEQKENLKALKSSSESLMTIINDILDLSKIEVGKVKLEFYDFNLKELLSNLHRIFLFNAKEKFLNFELILDEKLPEMVKGDKVRLSQILSNLISNAIKFTEKGSIKIHVTKIAEQSNNNKISFLVKDTGIGIPEESLNTIFDTFVQVSSSTSRKYKGTGLGLTIVKKLLTLHNSDIQVKTKVNEGSEFYFELDFEKADKVSKIENSTFEYKNFSNLKLLLVEDNSVNILVASKILKKYTIYPDIAKNGLEAVEKAKNKVYDLILMDINMPEMDGIEATKHIRNDLESKNKNTIITVLTADVTIEVESFLLENKMDYFISKPFNNTELIKVLNYVK